MKPLTFINRLIQPVKITIFPSFCKVCGRLLEKSDEKIVCQECLSRVEIHRGLVCQVCGRFLYHETTGSSTCLECQKNPPPFTRHRSLGPYSGRLKELIILFKYKGYEALSQPLAGLAYKNFITDGLFPGVDFILPVPLYRLKERDRGFNQAELLARELSRLSRRPVLKGVLVKTKNTAAQVSLEAKARESNLKGAFAVRKPEKIQGCTLLLVDDVYTTGSTIRECAQVLRQAGAREIRALTLARA
ncbi:MAG: ComF family protein [Candidatus Aminicenantes bacterium]|nr:ComF family protein [Candidatus Aminicenantes bacterium]